MIPYHAPKHTRTHFAKDRIAVRILQTDLEMQYLYPVDLAKMRLTEDARVPNAKTTKVLRHNLIVQNSKCFLKMYKNIQTILQSK